MSDRGPYIETFTGGKFYLLDPRADEVNILDIARSLSQQNRFTGHTHRPYYVAEHNYHQSKLCKEYPLEALLDDAEETYLGDMNAPLKHHTPLGEIYRSIAEPIKICIAEHFGLHYPFPPIVKEIDITMLRTEQSQLMSKLEESEYKGKEANIHIVGYSPQVIEKLFLQRFYELT